MDSSQLLRALTEQTENHALILLNERGVVMDWMMSAPKIFGRTAADMLGRTLHCLFTDEDQQAGIPESELEQACRTGSGEDDRWMVRSDGARFWASGVVYCLRNGDAGPVGYAKVLRDRTDVRGQVEALRNRAELLAAEDRRHVTVLGTLAHELRNPLGAVSNAVHLIDRVPPGDQRVSQALQILKRQTTYMSTLVEDLLELVRARTGKVELNYASIDVADLVADALQSAGALIRERAQSVEALGPPAAVRIEGDRTRLTQVLVNLLGNAAKFSPRGGTIWIKWTLEADEAVVRIEDRGRGISAALLPHVFDLFSQAEASDDASRAGIGLGLSLVKEYVELHGGTVQVRSEGIGRGSEFSVRLPLTRRATSAAAADAPQGDLPIG